MIAVRLTLLAALVAGGTIACGGNPVGPKDPSSMWVTGRAGWMAGALLAGTPLTFSANRVEAWMGSSEPWAGGRVCDASWTQSKNDGSFSLEVPHRCFDEGQAVYFVVSGLATCTSRPFRSGGHIDDLTLLGQSGPCY